MNARALICDEHQHFSLEDVVLNDPDPDQVAIRTHYSGVSIGTEFGIIRSKIGTGPYPMCTGYQATGVVEAVGSNVTDLRVGDAVYYRYGQGMTLTDGASVKCAYGLHCTHAVTSVGCTHGAAKMVPGAPMDVASMFVMPAVGLYGVDMAEPHIGQIAVVHGVGLIGIGVLAACAHRGCVIIAVDMSEKRLALAKEMGADYLINARTSDVAAEVKKIAPEGADFVFESTGNPACVDPAIALCRTYGTFVWEGHYGDKAKVGMTFDPPHGRRLRMFFPCDDGWQPCRRAVIKNMAMGTLKWEKCITHRIPCTDAPAMFQRINEGKDESIIGVVINWQG